MGETALIWRHQLFMPSETFIRDQALSLETFDPLFVARDAVTNAPPHARSVSLRDHGRISHLRYSLTRSPSRLHRLLAEFDPRVLHAHFGVEGVYALPLAERLDIPLITTFHGFDASMNRRQLVASRHLSWFNYALMLGRLARRGSRFVCVSEHVRRQVLRHGIPEERTVLLATGVDTDLLKPSPLPLRPRIVHVARLVPKKGTSTLLKAFQRVSRSVPEATLEILGDGPLRPPLETLTAELNLSSRVTFHGATSHSEALSAIARSTVLCLPSQTAPNGDQEGLGTVLLEAAALSRPVVGTRHGGIPEAVRDGETGLLVDENDVVALANALMQLLRDRDAAADMGLAGRQFVTQNFDLQTQTRKLEEIYRACL